jgi:hypothetical protein
MLKICERFVVKPFRHGSLSESIKSVSVSALRYAAPNYLALALAVAMFGVSTS